jgi:hypothetical protein
MASKNPLKTLCPKPKARLFQRLLNIPMPQRDVPVAPMYKHYKYTTHKWRKGAEPERGVHQ